MQTYLNQRKILFKKLQTWWKIQQLMIINIWFSLSSGSKLKIIIDILQLNTNSSKSWLQFRFNQNHDSSKGIDLTPIRVTFRLSIIISVVLKVVDIEPQGSIGPSKGSINSHGAEWGSLNNQGSMTNCWGLLEQWSLQIKIIVNPARNANSVFQQIKQKGWSNLSYSSLKAHSIGLIF